MALPVILLCAFVLLAVTVVMFSVRAYRGTVTDGQQSYESRISVSYITEKVRQSDTGEGISVTGFGDGDAIVLNQEDSGHKFSTYLYIYDGNLMELFTEEGVEVSPAAGTVVTEMASLEAARQGDVLEYTCTFADGTSTSSCVYIRSGEVSNG